MVGALLTRGMFAGLIAGAMAFGLAKIIGEPQVDRAIAFEEIMNQANGEAPEVEVVSRALQSGIGLFAGVVVYSAAMGGLFALVFAVAYGRVGRLSPRVTAALLACAGFITTGSRSRFKISPQSTLWGRAGDNWVSHRVVLLDDLDLENRTDGRDGDWPPPSWPLRRLECGAHWRSRIHCHCRRCSASSSRYKRGSGAVSSGCAVAFQDRVARHRTRVVDGNRTVFWRRGRTCSGKQ